MSDQAEKLRQLTRELFDNGKGVVVKKENVLGQENKCSRVIAVTSGKGGVGKTNFTVNVALALANLGQSVLIIDADLGMANIEVILGLPTTYNLLNLLEGELTINDIIVKGPRDIKFISGGSGIEQLANLGEAQLQKIIHQIALCEEWADFILIDTGAGINRNTINFVMSADEVIIVTTPEPTAITDAYAVMKTYAANNGRAPLKLVINRVIEPGEGEIVAEKLIKVASRFLKLQASSLGSIYEDINLIRAVKNQKPVLLAHPDTVSSRCIENISERLLEIQSSSGLTGINAFFSKFFKIIQRN